MPVTVTGPGLERNLPGNLDRPGPRLPIGQVTVPQRQKVTLTFEVDDNWFVPQSAIALFRYVVATPAGERDRIVPVAQACGEYVDWYRSER
jgi:hypothetical protein